jgi:hypothetical protein
MIHTDSMVSMTDENVCAKSSVLLRRVRLHTAKEAECWRHVSACCCLLSFDRSCCLEFAPSPSLHELLDSSYWSPPRCWLKRIYIRALT